MMAQFLRSVFVGSVAVSLTACTSLIGSMAADTLTASIVNQRDPALIEQGVPAYLLLVDGFIHQSPDNEDLLAAGAQIYALYGASFSVDADAKIRLTEKAREYGARALCQVNQATCNWSGQLPYREYAAELANVNAKQVAYLYAFALGWLSYLDATSEDLGAVAELPWVEAAMQRAVDLDEDFEQGALHTWLGVLKSLRPPALGGEPELARSHFERSIELSGGHDLSVKVEYARRYARLMYEKELHDRLLTEVIAASADQDGYTLFNVLAQRDAEALLATSEEYF